MSTTSTGVPKVKLKRPVKAKPIEATSKRERKGKAKSGDPVGTSLITWSY